MTLLVINVNRSGHKCNNDAALSGKAIPVICHKFTILECDTLIVSLTELFCLLNMLIIDPEHLIAVKGFLSS